MSIEKHKSFAQDLITPEQVILSTPLRAIETELLNSGKNVINQYIDDLRESLSNKQGTAKFEAFLEHRRDKSLSGLIASAKTRENRERLQMSVQNAQQIMMQEITQQAVELLTTENPELNDEQATEIVGTVEASLDYIPNIHAIDWNNLIIETDIVDGEVKSKVTLSESPALDEIKMITRIADKDTKSPFKIEYRKSDLRLIGNTNRTQLKESNQGLKLEATAYTIKPRHGKVNKSTRVIVSVADDYDTTGRYLVYIQNSRDKYIVEYFVKEKTDLNWLGMFIGYFFRMDFEHAKRVLDARVTGINNAIVDTMRHVVSGNKYRILPLRKGARFNGFKISSTGFLNQWLQIAVIEKTGTKGRNKLFDVVALNRTDAKWQNILNVNNGKSINLKYLNSQEFLDKLDEYYHMENWSDYGAVVKIQNEMVMKFSHKILKELYWEIQDMMQGKNPDNIDIKYVLSQKDTKDIGKGDEYYMEGIVGNTDKLDFFFISYSAVRVREGDKRFVVDGSRRADQRKFMFRFNYRLKGSKVSTKFYGLDYESMLFETGLLTNNPKFLTNSPRIVLNFDTYEDAYAELKP